MRRRDALAVIGVATLVGCNREQSRSLRVPYVLAENFRPSRAVVSAELVADGGQILSERTELGPAVYADGAIERVPGAVWRVDRTLTGPVRLTYRIDAGTRTTVSLTERGTDCLRPEIEARRDGQRSVAYAFDCSMPPTEESVSDANE